MSSFKYPHAVGEAQKMDSPEAAVNTRNIRKSAQWMVRADDRILEYLVEAKSTTAKELSTLEFTHTGRSNISKRLTKLSEHDLIEAHGNGVYQLALAGWYYLDGGYNVDTGEFAVGVEPNELVLYTETPSLWGNDDE